jgi:hypothetical protein
MNHSAAAAGEDGAAAAVIHDDDLRLGFPFGDQLVEDEVDPSLHRLRQLVFTRTVPEIQHCGTL